jgi:hypothetical protein
LGDKSGTYFADCNVRKEMNYASDRDNAGKLLQLSEELVGEKFEIGV